MNSHEAIAQAVNKNFPDVAKALHKSTSLLHKWCEPSADWSDSGTYNPLDRLETIIETALKLRTPTSDAYAPIYYLAQRFNGIFIPLPKASPCANEVSNDLLKTIKEFGDLARVASDALRDGRISDVEAAVIEKEVWHLINQAGVFLQTVKEAAK